MEKIIYEAYLNEIANDKFGKTLTNKTLKYNEQFYFKNYKISNLDNKKYFLFFITSKIYIYLWLISIFYFTFQFFISIFIRKKIKNKYENIAFIDSKKSFYDINLVKNNNIQYLKKGLFHFSSFLSIYDKITAYIITYKTIYKIFKSKNKISKIEYDSLKLHIYDLYLLSLFCVIIKRKKINFYTNSHYCRWVYIASKSLNIKLFLIQHGIVKKQISFPFKFGTVACLYVYEDCFLECFNYYYSCIQRYKIIRPKLKLKEIRNKNFYTVFIASSMVSVDLEKEIIDWLISNNKYKVYIKLHPAYNYKEKFIDYKDEIKFIDYFPKVNFVLTYNSTLGYEYELLGEKVIWISDYENDLNNLYKELGK